MAAKKKDPGKQFERDFAASMPRGVWGMRIKDTVTRFKAVQNPCDFLIYQAPGLYLFELKSHLGASLPLEKISANQLEQMAAAHEVAGVRAGFLINYREHDATFWVRACDVAAFAEAGERKSLPISWCAANGIKVKQKRLRVNWRYDLGRLLQAIDFKIWEVRYLITRRELEERMAAVRQDSDLVTEMVARVNAEYMAELDQLVGAVEELLAQVQSGAVNDLSEDDLAYYGMLIPTLMYKANCRMAELGGMADVAKSKRREAYNNALLRVSGTVPEKKAKAESAIELEQAVEDVYSRVYTQFNSKMESAEMLYSGVKKALSHRFREMEMSNGRDIPVRRAGDDD